MPPETEESVQEHVKAVDETRRVLIAIERLQKAVDDSRAEIAAQGGLYNLKLTSVLDAIARFDSSLKILVHEVQMLKRGHIELSERVEKLESAAFQVMPTRKPRKKSRAKGRK